jgi:hypothetical protein
MKNLKQNLLCLIAAIAVPSITLFFPFISEAKKLNPVENYSGIIAYENEEEGDEGVCGSQRRSVKTGTDKDAHLIDLKTIHRSTISEMSSWEAPTTHDLMFGKYKDSRLPQEKQVYTLDVNIIAYKKETDSDYHIVLQEVDGDKTMIAEIPSPDCVNSPSPLLKWIKKTRMAFDAKFKVSSSFKKTKLPVSITGVAFFDKMHNGKGRAPNAIELHPLTKIDFY